MCGELVAPAPKGDALMVGKGCRRLCSFCDEVRCSWAAGSRLVNRRGDHLVFEDDLRSKERSVICEESGTHEVP